MVTRLQMGNVIDMGFRRVRKRWLDWTDFLSIGNGPYCFLASLWKLRLASDDCL